MVAPYQKDKPFLVQKRVSRWERHYLTADGGWTDMPYQAALFPKRADAYARVRELFGQKGRLNAVRAWFN
jgi:hypothetical protein